MRSTLMISRFRFFASPRIRLPSPPPRSATRLALPRCRAMMRALPMIALIRRRSPRERTARGSSAGNWSSSSGSSNLEESAMAAESRAERRHPPPAGRGIAAQGLVQHEEHEGAAQVAVAREHLAAAGERGLVELECVAHAVEHRPAAGLADPLA